MKHPECLLVGIGNPFRGDDAIGSLIINEISQNHPGLCHTKHYRDDLSVLIDDFANYPKVGLIDCVYAVHSDDQVGNILTFTLESIEQCKEHLAPSTHAFSVYQIISLAKTLNQLPQHLWIFGIIGQNFDTQTTLSLPLSKNMKHYVKTIMRQLSL